MAKQAARQQVRDAVKQAILETIQECKEAPSGVVYAAVMSVLSYSEYIEIISDLKREGKIVESNFLLKPVAS
jgi:hypothetical protein